MASQQVTPELRQWIVAQAQAGHKPETVLDSMRASGWAEDVAIQALEDTLGGFLAEHAKAAGLPPPVPVPGPDLADSPLWLDAGDRRVQVLMSMLQPRVVVFGSLLSDEECDGMVALARPRLVRSETVQTETGGSEVNPLRTSSGMFFARGENPLCARIEARIARLLQWPLENGEGLQVLHYLPGAEYRPHHDYFDPAKAGTATILKRGGQRVGSLVMYLSAPEQGRRHVVPRRGARSGADQGQCRLLQLRPAASDHPHPARRLAGHRRRKVGRHQVAARRALRLGPVHVAVGRVNGPWPVRAVNRQARGAVVGLERLALPSIDTST